MLLSIILTLLIIGSAIGAFFCLRNVDTLYGVPDRQTQRTLQLSFGSLLFWAAVILPPFALNGWLGVAGITTPPWWVSAIWAVIYLMLAGVFTFRAVSNRMYRSTLVRSLLSIGLCLALAIGWVVQAVGSFGVLSGDDPINSGRTDFVTNYDDEALERVLFERTGITFEQLLETVETLSLPERRDERHAAVAAAGADFQDPVGVPFKQIKTLLDDKADESALNGAISESMSEVELKILTDFLYDDAIVQTLSVANVETFLQNPWLGELKDDLGAIFAASDPDQRGFNAFAVWNDTTRRYQRTEQLSTNLDMRKFAHNQIRLMLLVSDCFDATTVEARETEHRWRDNGAVNNSEMRFVESPIQENGPSLILHHGYKFPTGEVETTELGINVYDMGPNIPAAKAEDKSTTSNPGTNPDTTKYPAYVAYQYSNGSEAFPTEKLGDYTVGTTVTAKCEKSIPGYRADATKKTATMVKGGVTITFVFTKEADPTYTLTLRQWKDRVGGEHIVADQTFTYAGGFNYSLQLGALTGYEPTSTSHGKIVNSGGAYSVQGAMPASDTTIDVVFTPARFSVLIHYRTVDGGMVPGVSDYNKPHQYGTVVSVNSPTSSNNHYRPQVETYYLDKMPAYNVEVTIYYDLGRIVDITVKNVVTYQVTQHYTDWKKDGSWVTFYPIVPDGMYANPASVNQQINGKDLIMTIWLYPNGRPADGNDWKDPDTAPSNGPGVGQNPIGSGTGDPGRGGETSDYDPSFEPTSAPVVDPTPAPVPSGSTGQGTDTPVFQDPIPVHSSSFDNNPSGGTSTGEAFTPPA